MPVQLYGGAPLIVDATPAIDPVCCCETGFCPEHCPDGAPSSLTVVITGPVLCNGTFVLTYDSGLAVEIDCGEGGVAACGYRFFNGITNVLAAVNQFGVYVRPQVGITGSDNEWQKCFGEATPCSSHTALALDFLTHVVGANCSTGSCTVTANA